MAYEVDKSYEFKVVGGTDPAEKEFLIEVDGPLGPTQVPMKKLPFQREKAAPAVLYCRVKGVDIAGMPTLTPNIARYVYELYNKAYTRGESFECTVTAVPDRPAEEPYYAIDRNGIFFRIYESEGLISKGQRLRCKFLRLTPQFFTISRIDEGARVQFYDLDALLDGAFIHIPLRRIIRTLVERLPELATARAELAAGNGLWVVTAARAIMRQLPEWFLQADLRVQNRTYTVLLDALRESLLFLLEGSSFLNALQSEQRRALQQQLTDLVDSIEPYRDTLEIIDKEEQNGFVERLLDKLQRSGYLYHPARRFAVLMLIFRLFPDKVANYLSRIFESIFNRDLENWKREPFRKAFVEQFEIYVRQARLEIDAMPVAETREQKSKVETILTAIALQILLSENNADHSRSWNLFYRYVSLMRPLNVEALLTKSFLSLLGADVSTRIAYEQLKQPTMMMTQATIMPAGDIFNRLEGTHRFVGGGLEITISANGLELRPEGRHDITERAIPDGLMPWLKPQVMVNGIRSLSGTRLRKLGEHNQWWHDIEMSLFDTEAPSVAPVNELPRRHAAPGDEVYIVIDGVKDPYNINPTFTCHIDDAEYDGGTGTLRRDEIVGYNLKNPPMHVFRTPEGAVRGFLASVVDINADGSYIFSLRDTVDHYIENTYNFDDEYLAVITGNSDRDYSAISYNGIGLYVERPTDGTDCRVGDIVAVRFMNIGQQGQLKAYITGYPDDPDIAFGKNEAFQNLIEGIGEVDNSDNEMREVEEAVFRDMDEILSIDNIREIIEIIRFKAIAESDLIKAYDYLRFGRLLALAIADEALAEKILTHASLLTLHQFYATNSRVDADKLVELSTIAQADPFLKTVYHRLEMVSWLEDPSRNAELYATVGAPSNELEGVIARMVLAYNMVHLSDGNANSIASDIKEKIKEKLNVNNETRRGKYYGSESKYLEFKTSLVYPATAPGEIMREAPEEQQKHILSRIAGLLNANGGQLYIGVNNDGYEVGMHDDFKYYQRHNGAMAGTHRHRIANTDNLCVFIEDLVNQAFGERIGRKIEVSVDEEAEKGVICITVEQSLEPVFFDGRLYVRQSGQSTREYHGEAIEDFKYEREELRAEHRMRLALYEEEKAAEEEKPETEISVPRQAEPIPQIEETPAKPTIDTSHWRPNLLHDHESGYVEPSGYLYFNGEDQLLFSHNDLWLDGDEDCRLALTIPLELAEGYLVLGYADEKAVKIPLSEIYARGENNPMKRYSDEPLLFAAIAGRDDALLCIAADSTGSTWRRVTRLSAIEQGHLNSAPRRFHDAPIDHTVAYDIVDSAAIGKFSDCLSDKMGSKRFGFTMRVREDGDQRDYKFNEVFKLCSPTAL